MDFINFAKGGHIYKAHRYKTLRRQCKMSLTKKVYLKRDFAAGVYLSEAHDPIPSANTLHMCKQYIYSIGKGGTGGGG